jgi:hypothetical protein
VSPRPIYENAQSLKDELEIATAVCNHLGCTGLRKLNPISYGIDFAILVAGPEEDGVWCLLEAKARNRFYHQWIISALKTERAAGFGASGLAVYFAWGARSGIDWEIDLWQWNPKVRTFILAGRDDRGDEDDKEPCLLVPRSLCDSFSYRRTS